MEQRYLNTNQLAAYLGKSAKAVRDMKDRGQLPYRKFHGKLYFDVNEINRLIEMAEGLRIEKIIDI